MACVKEIGKGVWALQTSFRMFGLIPIWNNGLLIKVGENSLAVVNAVELDAKGFEEVDKLCLDQKAKLSVIFSPGDWHHIYIPQWMDKYPEAAVYVVSNRVLERNKEMAERREKVTVLSREEPNIPEFKGQIELVPFLGAQYRDYFSGVKDRTEVVVFHPESGTMFVTDHCFPSSILSAYGLTRKTGDFAPNTGGFMIKDREQTKKSAERLLALPGLGQAVFSHLKSEHGCVYNEPDLVDKLRRVYRYYM